MKKYTLVIIGSGSAGLSAADVAGQLGLRGVALVEKEHVLGGECLHSGCVPSKALIHAGQAFPGDPESAWQHVRGSIDAIEKRSDNKEHVTATGIDVYNGDAVFIDAHTIQVGSDIIKATYILIATGSDPIVPPIPGLEDTPYLTNETFFAAPSLPKNLVIIGGGPIGCELAGAAAALGSKVTILQTADRLLPRETPAVSEAVKQSLEASGVTVLLSATTKQVSGDENVGVTVTYEAGSLQQLKSDAVLLATGRMPRTKDLALDKAGVKISDAGIIVDRYLRTSAKHIYAAGDVTTSPKFTHLAAQQAGLALRNMLSGPFKKTTRILSEIPAITFTMPEVARFGVDSVIAEQSPKYSVARLEYSDIDRAITDQQHGFVEVVVTKKGLIVGATVVGPQASELLSPLLVAAHHNVPLQKLATTMFAYPTLASGLNIIASRYASQRASRGAAFGFIRRRWTSTNKK